MATIANEVDECSWVPFSDKTWQKQNHSGLLLLVPMLHVLCNFIYVFRSNSVRPTLTTPLPGCSPCSVSWELLGQLQQFKFYFYFVRYIKQNWSVFQVSWHPVRHAMATIANEVDECSWVPFSDKTWQKQNHSGLLLLVPMLHVLCNFIYVFRSNSVRPTLTTPLPGCSPCSVSWELLGQLQPFKFYFYSIRYIKQN